MSSGATRAITPMSPIAASSSSSDMAWNSAPVIALPGMPSSLAMAAAVTAWSPVIIRTRIPAACAVSIADFAVGRGGSTIPTRASMVRPPRSGSRSADGSNPSGSKSLRPVASTRRPCLPRRSFSSMYRCLNASSAGTIDRSSGSGRDPARASSWSGAPLTKARTTSRPLSSRIRWKVPMSLYAESNGSSATRGYSFRVAAASSPPFSASTTSAPSVGSPIRLPSLTTASAQSASGSRNWSSGTSGGPNTCLNVPSVA